MNVSYRWLQAIAPSIQESPQALAERLAGLGAPVEDLRDLAEGLEDVVVGRVLEAGRHPNADRLSVCRVDPGTGEELHIVCGAPNVRTGLIVAVAPVGATLPIGITLKRAKIRGEVSEGMICSARELGLGDEHDRILELPDTLTVGTPLVEALGLGDWCLDVEVTSNRPDLLSHVGVAREVAPGGHADLRLPELPRGGDTQLTWQRGGEDVASNDVRIQIEDPDLCPRYLGAVIRGVEVGPSPEWLQRSLRSVGARPINNVVDATNFVLLELGQPMHAFDLAKVTDAHVIVRTAREGERVRTLDGQDRALQPEMLMICDPAGPIAVAGVMGGEESEVTTATTDVLLECALFHPGRTRQTRKALDLSTDASYRYERGVDPEGQVRALERCVEIILAVAGGEVGGPVVDANPRPHEPLVVGLRLDRIERVLGVAFSSEQVERLLSPLGFGVARTDDLGVLEVTNPGFRCWDVRREIDLIEEIARRHGYDAFPADLAPYRASSVPDDPRFEAEERLRRLLIAEGFHELSTPAFAEVGDIELPNPVSAAESHLRRSLVPGVLARVRHNLARGVRDPRLFEIGTAFFASPEGPEGRPGERTRLAVCLSGRGRPPHWTEADRDADLWDIKGLGERLARALGQPADPEDGATAVRVEAAPPEWLDPAGGTVALHRMDGTLCGWAGRVRGDLADVPAWSGPVWALEVELPVRPATPTVPTYQPVPAHPAVERDLALLVGTGVASGRVEETIRAAAGKLLESVALFDRFQGEGVPEGHRSLAYRLTFRARDRTLRDEDVDPKIQRVLKRLKEELDVRPRG